MQEQKKPRRTYKHLQTEDVQNILTALEQGTLQKDLAQQYGVSRATINNIAQRKTHKAKKHPLSNYQLRFCSGGELLIACEINPFSMSREDFQFLEKLLALVRSYESEQA